jgi:hypothetical protein
MDGVLGGLFAGEHVDEHEGVLGSRHDGVVDIGHDGHRVSERLQQRAHDGRGIGVLIE